MSAVLIHRASSPEEDSKNSEERKRKRMQSNRDSARRSRMRKQQHLDTLIGLTSQLKLENADLEARVDMLTDHYIRVENENRLLRVQKAELAERLRSYNDMLRMYMQITGVPLDIEEMPESLMEPWQLPDQAAVFTADSYPEIMDPLMNPWQVPYTAQPLMATATMAQF